MASFGDRILRDLRASWQKTAILGVLLLVGLCFWVPPLLRMMGSGSDTPPGPPVTETVSDAAPIPATGTSGSADSGPAPLTLADTRKILASDPLVRSAGVDDIGSDPFRVNVDRFPPPVLFAEDDEPELVADDSPAEDDVAPMPGGLVLSTTLVGTQRRIAIINNRAYHEGGRLRHEGLLYVLAHVDRRSAVLERAGRRLTLRLSKPAGEVEGNTVRDR